MKKQKLLNILILVTTVLVGTVKAFGYAEVEQMVNTSVQPAVAIEKTSSSENGTINPETGVHEGLSASFTLKTNGTDENYDFIVGAKINTIDGEVSGYTSGGALLFANTTTLPTTSAVNNAKIGNTDNRNVIAYPITMNITTPMEVSYDNTRITDEGKGCYIVKVKTANEGTLTQTVGTTPVSETYAVGQDEAGTYKATVYFTAVSK